jgi:hypothetical protein
MSFIESVEPTNGLVLMVLTSWSWAGNAGVAPTSTTSKATRRDERVSHPSNDPSASPTESAFPCPPPCHQVGWTDNGAGDVRKRIYGSTSKTKTACLRGSPLERPS